MAKPKNIELPTGEQIAVLYEDRSVIAIDKPRGWMLVPFSWQKTQRNLQAAIVSSIAAGDSVSETTLRVHATADTLVRLRSACAPALPTS